MELGEDPRGFAVLPAPQKCCAAPVGCGCAGLWVVAAVTWWLLCFYKAVLLSVQQLGLSCAMEGCPWHTGGCARAL